MQSVHHPAVHAAVQWAEEKLSINLQHFIPLQSSEDCSESLQIMWEHNTLSLNFHLIIRWVRTFMYFSASVIAIVSFSGCYLEAFCNFASILKHCKEFTASMRQPLLPPKYFLFSSIPGHLAHLPLSAIILNIFLANLIQFLYISHPHLGSDRVRGAAAMIAC